jgi:endonuclease/exonuclease/phosphatase family metal-dependent hydrolase
MDVILVRSDIEYSNEQAGNFGAVLPIAVGGQPLGKPSGWASVDLTVKGLPYRIVNSHLEAADIAPGVVDPALAGLQAAQASELLGLADASPYPVILMGDLNSAADGSSTATYQDILDAGFVDAWMVGKPRGDGFTSGQDPDLRNPISKLHHRIDFIFYRDDRTREGGPFRGSIHVERVGEEEADRTVTGMWPSDHAGVFAALRMAPGVGN